MELPPDDNNAWIDNSLQGVSHPLYATDLPPLNPSTEQQHANNMFGFQHQQALVGNFDDPGSGLHRDFQHQFSQCPAEQTGAAEDLASVRRVHKADREKMRRDRLNEQFSELANTLDPDRPKNDKATILSDSVQELNELRAEVKRLKSEHTALLDESRDLTHEKSELREERALLKADTEQLQAQLQQRLRLAVSWTPMDPSLMMGAFPYPVPVPPPVPSPSSQQQTSPQSSNPVVPPSPFGMPLPPPGAFAMHPYAAMFANRPTGGGMPFFPYYPHGLGNSSVERPYPQYASPMHPVRGYGVQPQDEPPFKAGVPFANQTTGSTTTATRSREDNNSTQATESSTDCQVSGDVQQQQQQDGSSSPVKQESAFVASSQSLVESPET